MDGARTTGTSSTKPPVVWGEDAEQLLHAWHRRVAAAEAGHRKLADSMRGRYFRLGIPVVILSTIVGTSVFVSLQEQRVGLWLKVIVGAISLLAAVLSSLQTFLRYAERSEGHRIAAIRYETLRRDIAKQIALPPGARGDPKAQLESNKQRMDRYGKESPLIGEHLWSKLEKEFHLRKVPPDPRFVPETVTLPDAETSSTER